MGWKTSFEELDKSVHDRSAFDCGEHELNLFVRTRAARHMQAGISRTMVLPATDFRPGHKLAICAFYSIAPGSVRREDFPAAMAKKLPNYPVPVFLLAQLAVDKKFHGKGLGKICLIKALEHLWAVNSHMRAYAVIVDCLTDAAERFYLNYGFEKLTVHNCRTRMFLPMKTVERLFTDALR